MATMALYLLAGCVIALLLWRPVRRARRRARVAKELRDLDDRRHHWDEGAARVLAFHDALERRGYYVSELKIEKRLN